MASKPSPPGGGGGGGGGGYDWSMGLPVTKETDTTYGGTKPGKAPTQKTPKAPDPFELIRAQGVENRVNEVGPSGSTIYNRDPTSGVWTANRSFSPELQGLFDKQVSLVGQDPNAYNQDVANAMFSRTRSMLDPVFEQQNRAQKQSLANKGIPMGSEAYTTDWETSQRMQNKTYEDAANQATLAGTQTGMSQRTNEFNQLAALLGGQQIGPTAPIDVTGPFSQQYQGQLNSVNAANQNAASRNAQTTSGAASLASLLAMIFMSSKEAKENMNEIDHDSVLEGVENLPVESWTYKEDGKQHIGPYAEDFKEIFGFGNWKEIAGVDAIGVCLSAIKALTKRVKELEAANA